MKLSNRKVGRGHVDSPAKKLVRLHVLETAVGVLGDRFFEGCHLGLASREAGDYSTLGGMGVRGGNIVLAETDEAAWSDAIGRWPHADIRHKDVLEVAKEYPYAFAHINFDTCAPLRETNISTMQELMLNHLEPGGVFTCWFLGGREKDVVMEEVLCMEDLLKQHLTPEVRKDIIGRGKYPMEVLDDRLPFIARALVLEQSLNAFMSRAAKMHTRLVRIWNYISTDVTNGKLGSPMVVVQFTLRSKKAPASMLTDEMLTAISHDHFMVSGDCRKRLASRALELHREGKRADLLLNVAKQSLSAWQAHETRGTYGEY